MTGLGERDIHRARPTTTGHATTRHATAAPAIDQVRAKFRCQDVKAEHGQAEVTLTAIYGTEGENADFTTATPWGALRMGIFPADRPAATFLKPGRDYYLTLAEAPD